MQDVQNWLVSTSIKEKESIKDLIQKALEGLDQSSSNSNRFIGNPNKNSKFDSIKINNSIKTYIQKIFISKI